MYPTRWMGRLPVVAVVLVTTGFLGALPAWAADVMLTIEATCADGTSVLEIALDDGTWDGSTFSWLAEDDIALRDGGMVIATLAAGTYVEATMPVSGAGVRAQPKVNVGFAVQAGPSDTEFTITSSLVTFDPMENPWGRATAAFTLTDGEFDGAWLSGDGPGGGGYIAQYNGFVPGGMTFAEVLGDLVVEPGGTVAEAVDIPPAGWLPIAGTVTNMSAQIAFTLSGEDLASGTTNWELIPEPASVALLTLGLGLARRRR